MKTQFEPEDFDQLKTLLYSPTRSTEYMWADMANCKLAEIKKAWANEIGRSPEELAHLKDKWLAELKANATEVHGILAHGYPAEFSSIRTPSGMREATHRAYLIGISPIEERSSVTFKEPPIADADELNDSYKKITSWEPNMSIEVFGMNEYQIKQCMDFYVAHHGALPEAEEIKPKECEHENVDVRREYYSQIPGDIGKTTLSDLRMKERLDFFCLDCDKKLKAKWEVAE